MLVYGATKNQMLYRSTNMKYIKNTLFLLSEPDKKDKGLRKDVAYLYKVFGAAVPFWLFYKVL